VAFCDCRLLVNITQKCHGLVARLVVVIWHRGSRAEGYWNFCNL